MWDKAIGENRSNFRWKRFLKYVIPLSIVLLLALGVWYYFVYGFEYVPKTLENKGVTYSIKFNRMAQAVTIGGKNYLSGGGPHGTPRIGLYVTPTQDPLISNCHEIGSSWAYAFTATIHGTNYLVCTARGIVYSIIFESGAGSHHMVELISKDNRSTIDRYIVQEVMESAQVLTH